MRGGKRTKVKEREREKVKERERERERGRVTGRATKVAAIPLTFLSSGNGSIERNRPSFFLSFSFFLWIDRMEWKGND